MRIPIIESFCCHQHVTIVPASCCIRESRHSNASSMCRAFDNLNAWCRPQLRHLFSDATRLPDAARPLQHRLLHLARRCPQLCIVAGVPGCVLGLNNVVVTLLHAERILPALPPATCVGIVTCCLPTAQWMTAQFSTHWAAAGTDMCRLRSCRSGSTSPAPRVSVPRLDLTSVGTGLDFPSAMSSDRCVTVPVPADVQAVCCKWCSLTAHVR